MNRSWPLLFIIIPLIELYFIIVVGDMIGAIWTVLLVLLTAVIGVNLLRFQGMSTLARAQRNMAQGSMPAMEMMEGIALAIAGVLLITPGFITDTIGFLLLIPASRRAIIRYILARTAVRTNFAEGSAGFYTSRQQQPHESRSDFSPETGSSKVGRTIEGEYHRED